MVVVELQFLILVFSPQERWEASLKCWVPVERRGWEAPRVPTVMIQDASTDGTTCPIPTFKEAALCARQPSKSREEF